MQKDLSKFIRIEWIDNGKAIAALLIICLHIPTNKICTSVINSFVIPYFFFLSGITFKLKEEPFIYFCKRKIKTLVLPAIILCGILLDILRYVYSMIIGIGYPIDVKQNIIGIALQMRGSYEYGAWFLICLFSAEIIVYILLKYILKSEKLILICSICFFVVGCGYSVIIHKPLPWSLDVALLAVAYILLGYYIKEKNLMKKLLRLNNVIIYFVMFLLGNIALLLTNSHINMWIDEVGNPIFMLMTTVGGIGFISFVCHNIKKNKVTDFIGKNSMLIYCLQYFPIYVLDSLLKNSKGFTIWMIYFIVTILVTGTMAYIIKNYLPFLAGMGYKKKA